MDVSQADRICYAYNTSDLKAKLYGPNPYNIRNSRDESRFPYSARSNTTLTQIAVFDSKNQDLGSEPAYSIVNQAPDPVYGDQIYLEVSSVGQDNVLPGWVDDRTLLATEVIAPALDVLGYIPSIYMLTKTCA
jgi:hypothetical protein